MRERILDAAEQLLGRLGYQKMTVDDIAAEAQIGRRTIYLHFAGKEDVALATIDRIVARLLVRLQAHAAADAAWDERLRRMLMERVMFRFDSVRGYHHSIDEIFRSLRGAYMERRGRYFAAEANVFAAVLAGACGPKPHARHKPELWAESLLLATNSLLPSVLSPRELGERAHVEEQAARIVEIVVGGVRPLVLAAATRPRGKGNPKSRTVHP
jgi:AcrR family transcriptional regulator